MTLTVSGYASLDRAMLVDRLPDPDETSIVRRRLSASWPTAGGAAYVARAAAAAGADTSLVTWLGSDDDGQRYLDALSDSGVDLAHVDRAGRRSPASWLFYDDDGHVACYFDPGDVTDALTASQRRLLDTSSWWVLTVGPPDVTEDVLDDLAPSARLAWVVKADPLSFPPGLVERLLDRCDVITHNRDERRFLTGVDAAAGLTQRVRDGAVVIETAGSDEVHFCGPDGKGSVPVESLPTTDTTGAGDTLAGAAIAALSAGASPRAAAEAGVAAAHDLLTARTEGRT